tara:strand:+ start:660 stop:1211 length:552 start_codon:yes stop_codon:yes gene_type:complete
MTDQPKTWVTQSQLSKDLEVSTTTVKDLTAKNILTRTTNGYDLRQARLDYIAHLREMAAGRYSGELNLQEERARLAKEQADAKEMENMIERGELVYIDHIVKRFEKQLIKCKTKLLAAPTKIAAEVHAAADVKEVKAIMEAAIEEALSELVGYDQDDEQEEVGSQADGDVTQGDGSTAKANSK